MVAKEYGATPTVDEESFEEGHTQDHNRGFLANDRTRLLTLAALALAMGFATAYAGMHVYSGRDEAVVSVKAVDSALSASTSSISFQVSNVYDNLGYDSPGEKYSFISSDKVIEPMRTSTLTASLSGDSDSISSCSWTVSDSRSEVSDDDVYEVIRDKSVSTHQTLTGQTVTIRVPSPGKYKVELSCDLDSGDTLKKSDTLNSYYVRRELRELIKKDRKAFLDAVEKVYYCDESCSELYGKYFHTSQYFTEYHLEAAGTVKTDHIHDGLGFLPQHIAITNEFELALQSVDPIVAMPYWDYTIDSIEIRNHGDTESWFFEKSELFSSEWFGRTSRKDHIISDGRFASLTVPMASEDSSVKSPYGYMRAPWNLNPSKYVTRFHKVCGEKNSITSVLEWPTCGTHFRLVFSDSYDTFKDFTWEAIYLPHGPVHTWIGGVGGGTCQERIDMLSDYFAEAKVEEYKAFTFVMLKNLYRHMYINTPKECDLSDIGACKFHCIRDKPSEAHEFYTYIRTFFPAMLDVEEAVSNSLSKQELQRIADLVICENTYWPGDQLESGSPSDPAFWPIHPTMERLFHFKALVKPFTEVSFNYTESELCLYSDQSGCEGHHAYDKTYFTTTVYDQETNKWVRGMLSNLETLHATLPREDSYIVPYIYNHFKWPHCEHEGWDFTRSHADS